jgi:hypothetical protein
MLRLMQFLFRGVSASLSVSDRIVSCVCGSRKRGRSQQESRYSNNGVFHHSPSFNVFGDMSVVKSGTLSNVALQDKTVSE